MLRIFCKSKLHIVHITETELEYEGSITIDSDLLDAADMLPYERVQVLNLENGNRFETYIIPGERGSGMICLNGPAARKGMVGDRIIVVAYAIAEEKEFSGKAPLTILVDKQNKITAIKNA
ncbi:aspartate 1-decarboxylase [bacterium]|nr:aspartate 1-decarboxylase [bacterium]